MKHSTTRILSLLLALAMVLTMLPVSVFAADETTATWSKVELADITAEDTIAITMTNPNGVTYALYTQQSGSYGPDAKVVTVSEDGTTLTTDGTSDYGWTITATDDGYTITVDGQYLYSIDSNNGVRIGSTVAVWTQDGDYLSTTDTGGNTRWLGVYDNNGGDYSAVTSPNWRAYKNTTGNTKSQILGLWKLNSSEEGTDPDETPDDPYADIDKKYSVYEKVEIPEDGDTVILYNSGNGMILSSEATSYYRAGVAATADDGIIATDADLIEWTVGVEDDEYTFTQGDLALAVTPSSSYFNLSTSADDSTGWTLEVCNEENSSYYLCSSELAGTYGNVYLEWYASKSAFSAYCTGNLSETDFGFEFYKLVREGVEEEIPEESTEPSDPSEPDESTAPFADGDQVVIYAPAYGKALSTKKTSYYNVGVDVTVTDGVLSGYGETEIWTVIDNDDGTYSFANGGQNIGLADSYTSMDLGAVNDKWELADLGDGLYTVKNTVRGNYLEWYSTYSNWSTLNTTNAATDDRCQISFYVIPEVREEGLVSELHAGDTVVIFNPANMKTLSTEYSGFYNAATAVTLTDGKLSGYTSADVWTVGVNDDGSYTFSTAEGKKLSMGASYTSMPLDDVNTDWEVSPAATADCFYIKNTARSSYMEYQTSYGTWSAYYNIGENEDLFAQQFYLVTDTQDTPSGGEGLQAGDEVVIYNLSAKGVLSLEGDNQCITNVSATIEDGVATVSNGGVIFTVEENDAYYRFYNESYGYLCSNGTGNNAFYSLEASEDADWTLTAGKSGGYNMESRTAKYNGTYSQYLEYYAGSYKTYSMYNVTDYDIYEFCFYPVAEGLNITNGVVNQPGVIFSNVQPAYLGADYTYTFGIDAVFGVEELTVVASYGSVSYTLEPTLVNDLYTVALTAEQLAALNAAALAEGAGTAVFSISISGTDTTGIAFANGSAIDIIDEPSITDVTPAANTQTGEDKKPTIRATITNEGEDATVTMTVNGEAVDAVYENGTITYTPAEDLADGSVSVTVTVTRADGKVATKTWRFTVGQSQYQLYFGQLHSHTTYSDGSGSLDSALEYVANLPESANVDFVAFTDHSNYFDTSSAANPESALYDMSTATSYSQNLWTAYKDAIAQFNETSDTVIAIGGFEMTWSGGPGHINTFNTEGIVSRNNSTLNNKTNDAGMKAYYALLSQAELIDSISQFNHPGSTFGTFSDFSYWDAVIDSRIYLVEVGNGEGAIGAGGYYPSYEYYTMALDKGWHVAPTNNQDNHKGKWGNANDARDVILTDDFSEEGIYEAIQALRVYATEDKNLEIRYTVNGQQLGSIIEEVPETLNVNIALYDPDASDSISKVELIVNSGKTAYTWDDPAVLASGELTATLSPDYSYYYVRVTQGDGDLAVTAPVWVGETLMLGISAAECGTSTPVTGEELEITTTLFNSESSDATIKSVTYTTNGSEVLGTDTTGYTIPASGTAQVTFAYTPSVAKVMTITVTAVVELDGIEYTFTKDVELDVQDASKLVYIGIDASHYNEYVNGNYKDSMGNFSELAAEYNVRTVTLYESEDLIAACSNEKYKALILTAPSRRSSEAQSSDPLKVYTEEELAAIVEFNANGGIVILAGWSDHYENYPDVDSIANMDASEHMAATQNAVLEALGSSLRIGDDATYDDSYNGGQAYRLYFNTYGDSFLNEGVEVDPENPHDRLYTEVFSHYGGASVYTVDGTLASTVTPVVFGHDTTYSVDVDGDGLGGDSMPKYTYAEGDDRLMIMATEQLEGQGLIIVSGAAFMSNFEVQATIEDSGSEKNYSNYKICENLLAYINPAEVTPIAEVQAQTEAGFKYTIEGVVTSNASGYDKDTAFFDCIYIQDETGGICCFPVAGNYKIGDKVRITGTTDFYQGEMELQVTDITILSQGNEVTAKEVTAAQVNDGSVLGQLVAVSGTVQSYEYANNLIQTILVKDAQGDVVRIFIDGYITTSEDVQGLEVGAGITVTGLASYDNTFDGAFPRIRVRNRADVVVTGHVHSYTKNTVAPTCTTEGYTEYICDCGYSYRDTIQAALGHTPGEVLYCCGDLRLIQCAVCGKAYVEDHECATAKFKDLNPAAWYHSATDAVLDAGIMKGTDDGVFSPDLALTRAQTVTILYRLAGEPEVEQTAPFTDVAADSYYADAVAWGYAKGIVNGISADEFAPNQDVTRQELVTFFHRYVDEPAADAKVLDAYSDSDDISSYAVDAMSWAIASGIVNGTTDTTLSPKDNAKRVQAAAIIQRFLAIAE